MKHVAFLFVCILLDVNIHGQTFQFHEFSVNWADSNTWARNIKAIADFDGDKDGDFIASESRKLSFIRNEGKGKFTSYDIDTMTSGILISVDPVIPADIDKDGDMDFIGQRSFYGGEVYLWENLDKGIQWKKHLVLENTIGKDILPYTLTLADLDGDQDMDLLMGNTVAGLQWMENKNLGQTWGSPVSILMSLKRPYQYAFLSGDFDKDNDVDLLIPKENPEIVFFENTNNSWTGIRSLKPLPYKPEVIRLTKTNDIDADGDLDILTVIKGVGMAFYINDGKGQLVHDKELVNIKNLSLASFSDIDTDGDMDIVHCQGDDNGGTIAWSSNTNGKFTEAGVICKDWKRPAFFGILDIDGDGDPDILSFRDESYIYEPPNNDVSRADMKRTVVMLKGGWWENKKSE